MRLLIDEDALRTALTSATMEDVHIGWDDPDARWIDAMAGDTPADLEDTIRALSAVEVFGPNRILSYRYAARAPDESIDSVLLILSTDGQAGGGLCAEIGLRAGDPLPSDPLEAALLVADRAASALNRVIADVLPQIT
jgi:hypothetical protein